jgi:hypothetical protein
MLLLMAAAVVDVAENSLDPKDQFPAKEGNYLNGMV